ncbi:MAG: hypothetical protein Q7R79_00335 [bacterium]|nr:hypothetical protein [bacterium]
MNIELQKPWSFAFESKENWGVNVRGVKNENAPEGSENVKIDFFLPLVDEIRTFFKENPTFDL